MTTLLTAEQQMIQEVARNFANEQLAPAAATWDEEKIFPEAELRAAAALS